VSFGNELKDGREPQSRDPNAQGPEVQQAQGIGVARLRMLMIGGMPQPDAVIKLLADYPLLVPLDNIDAPRTIFPDKVQ
jgi:hypothetical protein